MTEFPIVADDPRYAALRRGLAQLTNEELQRILDTPDDQMIFDGGNYDPITDRYCPMAVALEVPEYIERFDLIPNQYRVDRMIGGLGTIDRPNFAYNQMHGTPGNFYRDDRPADLRRVIADILAERSA